MNKKARTLKGFRDFRGDELRIRKKVFSIFAEIFEKYGFEPLETATLEYADVLLDKYGEEEKLLYKFIDHGEREVAMRYDLTVPTARHMAQNRSLINLPWKRYQIQPVWRADNTQRGRYREFYQLDADVLGTDSMLADSEFILMGIEIMQTLGFKEFKVSINNRKILNAIAEYAGRPEKFTDVVYAIDKWDKRTPEETRTDLLERLRDEQYDAQTINQQIDKIFSCIELEGDNLEKLNKLSEILTETEEGQQGVNELKQIFELVGDEFLEYDPTIARGLAYYTGPIWEWRIIEGNIGSVGGAGRYDKLVESLLGEEIPATGGSFGIERILDVMKERGMLEALNFRQEKVLVSLLDENLIKQTFAIAQKLREAGIATVLYPDAKPISKQFDYADKQGMDYVIIIGDDELRSEKVSLKDMKSGEQQLISLEEAISIINNK